MPRLSRDSSGADFIESPSPSASPTPKMSLHVGVLHYTPFRRAHNRPAVLRCVKGSSCIPVPACNRHADVAPTMC